MEKGGFDQSVKHPNASQNIQHWLEYQTFNSQNELLLIQKSLFSADGIQPRLTSSHTLGDLASLALKVLYDILHEHGDSRTEPSKSRIL